MACYHPGMAELDRPGMQRSNPYKVSLRSLAIFAATLAVGVSYVHVTLVPPAPRVNATRWWGAGPPRAPDTAVRPARVHFSDEMIEDLRSRLRNRRPLTKPLEGVQSQYGMNTDYLQQVLDRWSDGYDFKEREKVLNEQPHYRTNIQGLDIFFVHVKPKIPADRKLKVLPILLLHGWPSSSNEFLKVIPHLTTPQPELDYVFEVVAPDLPGFGFSQATTKPGLNAMEMGIMMRNLMRRLGHKQFYVQGGDWGSVCASHLATLRPNEVLGLHLNLPISSRTVSSVKLLIGSLYPSWAAGAYADRIYPLSELFRYIMRETGYFHIQATKPDTVGIGLTDSPTGLAGYILEKIATITHRDKLDTPHGGIGDAYDWDDLLDLLTTNWANSCVTTSMRIYAESAGPMQEEHARTLMSIPTPVPTAVINFKHEILYQPDWVLVDKYPHLVRSVTLDYGGHFPGHEHPAVLAADLWAAADAFIKYWESVKE